MLKFKIELSLFFLASFFFFRIMGPILVKKLKGGLIKTNPEFEKKIPWYFKFLTFLYQAFSIFCLVYIIMIWVRVVKT